MSEVKEPEPGLPRKRIGARRKGRFHFFDIFFLSDATESESRRYFDGNLRYGLYTSAECLLLLVWFTCIAFSATRALEPTYGFGFRADKALLESQQHLPIRERRVEVSPWGTLTVDALAEIVRTGNLSDTLRAASAMDRVGARREALFHFTQRTRDWYDGESPRQPASSPRR